MAELSSRDLLKWAFPNQREFIGYAFSEEHLDEITRDVSRDRQMFLGRAIISEVQRRQDPRINSAGVEQLLNTNEARTEVHPAELRFEDIPLAFTLSRFENRDIGGNVDRFYTATDANHHWNTQMQFFATLNGFRVWATKCDDYFCNPLPERMLSTERGRAEREKVFEAAVQRSQWLSEEGYNIRFLMNGAAYIYPALIDMGTIEDSLSEWDPKKISDRMDKVFARPIRYWQAVVAAKKKVDQKRGLKSYADVVEQLADGLYVAPYFPDELRDANQYIILDDAWRYAYQLGETAKTGTLAFRKMIKAAAGSPTKAAAISTEYFTAPPPQQKPGVLFFDRKILPDIAERLSGGKSGRLNIAQQLAIDMSDPTVELDDYKDLVFLD